MFGRGVDERGLVELVVEAALQKAGARVVTEPTEMPLDFTVLPMIVVGARGDETPDATGVGESSLRGKYQGVVPRLVRPR